MEINYVAKSYNGKPKLPGKMGQTVVGEEACRLSEQRDREFMGYPATSSKGMLPWKKIDFTYNSTDELFQEISKRYDMENLGLFDFGHILDMLKQGGAITSKEYWLGQSIVAVNGSSPNVPAPEQSENAIRDYYTNFKTYVDKYSKTYSPKEQQRLQDSLSVHEKIDKIFKQIHSYK